MATYSVTLYHNTGFDAVNIPDNPATLQAAAASITTVDSIVVVQDCNLDHIDVKTTWDEVNDVDYVRVGAYYYSVAPYGITMQSVTTARIKLVGDMMLSVGGVTYSNGAVSSKFVILGGVTERCTTNSDNWGEYASEDPLISPQLPLQLKTEWVQPPASGDDRIFVEATVDLPQQATPAFKEGITYTDTETGESVTIPETAQLPFTNGSIQHTDFTIDGSSTTNGTMIYQRNDNHTVDDYAASKSIERGLQVIHSLGQDQGSVISQYKVPGSFIGDVSVTYEKIEGETTDSGTVPTIGTEQIISNISGTNGTLSGTITPNYATVNNKRVLYGKVNSYGLITCAGNSCTFKPEDITTQTLAPGITYKSDPRPKGKPYYRFTSINSNTEFWRNALAGSEWENVPLIYQGTSGSALTRLNFDNERYVKERARQNFSEQQTLGAVDNVAQTALGLAGLAANTALVVGTAGTGGLLAAPAAISSGQMALSGIRGLMDTAQATSQYERTYAAQKRNELSQLYQATEIYAPTVNFPYNADILRDVKNNGVLLYKYEMTSEDVTRVDKLLTMYGYKTQEALTLSHFFHRTHFDYIACQGVSVGGVPKWQADEIAAQLKNGVRIWHEKPDSSIYDSGNSIRS